MTILLILPTVQFFNAVGVTHGGFILWCLVNCVPNVDCWSRCYILVCDPVCGTGLLCTLSCLWEVGGRERKWWGTLLAVKHCVIVLLLLAHMERYIGKPRMNSPLQLHTLPSYQRMVVNLSAIPVEEVRNSVEIFEYKMSYGTVSSPPQVCSCCWWGSLTGSSDLHVCALGRTSCLGQAYQARPSLTHLQEVGW